MKPVLSFFLCLFLTTATYAQKAKSCNDPAITGKANNIKSTFEKQGMVVFKEASILMQSMEPTPIVIRLQAGITYQFLFVGSSQASRISMELYDAVDKKIDEKLEKNNDYIIYTFKPTRTEDYLINLYQKRGAAELCGYFGIMTQKLNNAPPRLAPVRNTHQPTTTPIQQQPTRVKQTVKQTQPTRQTQQPAIRPTPQPASTTKETQSNYQETAPARNVPIPVRSEGYHYPKQNTSNDQMPNPNRTKATREYQQEQQNNR